MPFIDAHFHLDLWRTDPKDILEQIESRNIYTIAVTNTPSVFHYTQKITSKSKYVRAALGLHPELVKERHHEINQFIQLVDSTRYIGEIGLDFSSKNSQDQELQVEIFKNIIRTCRSKGDKVLTIHSRKAEKETIDIIGPNFPGKVILHWYSGSRKELKRAIDFGYYFSVNYSMIQSKNGQAIIAEIPENKLLSESDGPFINHKNAPFSPLRIPELVKSLSSQINLSQIEIENVIFQNMKRLLSTN